jgi:hypothetical protein
MQAGSPDASAVIWNWRAESQAPASAGSVPTRTRGVLQALAGGLAGTAIFFFLSQTVAYVVWTLAGVILLSALLSPGGAYALIDRGFLALGNLLGRAMTWIVLPAIFYGFFVPFGLLFRRGARDTMKRFYEPEADTYWTEPDPSRSGSTGRRNQY